MLRSALGYLAAADATAMTAEEQAGACGCWSGPTRSAPRRGPRSCRAFTAGQGYSADADYSAAGVADPQDRDDQGRGGGLHRVGAAGRDAPAVVAALAAGELSESGGRICASGPTSCRKTAGSRGRAAGRGGRGGDGAARTWPRCSREMYERARSDLPDEDPDGAFEDRGVRLETTFQGAGVLTGDLTPECAAVVGDGAGRAVRPGRGGGRPDPGAAVPRRAGQEAMRRLVAAEPAAGAGRAAGQGLGAHLPGRPAPAGRQLGAAGGVDRAGPRPVGRAPRRRVRERRGRRGLAGRRRRRGDRVRRGDGPDRDRRRQRGRAGGPGPAVRGTGRAGGGRPRRRPRPGPRSSRPSSARPWTCCPARAGWPASCAAGSSAPGWAGRACRWTSGTPRPSRPGSATR